MSRNALLGGLVAVLLFLLAVPFLFRPPAENVSASRELVVISPHWEAIIYEFDHAFRDHWKTKTGEVVKLRWLYMGGGTDALRFVLSEFKRSPQGIGVDLFWGGGVDPHEKMRKEGVLEPVRVDPGILAPIPQRLFGYYLYAPDRTWFGTAISGFGIVYNRKILERLDLPPPKDWADLACERCLSWVGTGDPANSSTAHAMVEYILQGYGFERGMEILTRIAANARRFDQHANSVNKDVALGETAMGMSIDFYSAAAIAKAGADKLGFVYPERLTVVNPDPVSLLRGAPNRELAAEFVSWLLTEEAQRIWLLPHGHPKGPRKYTLNRVPVIAGMLDRYRNDTTITYDPFKLKETLPYRQDFGSKRWTILNDFLRASLVDTHPELQAAWREVLRRPAAERVALAARLAAPVVTEEEMFRLIDTAWKEPAERNRIRGEWTATYMRRYRAIRGELARGRS
jgi:ABC-type Fe3+ transport system substrate-binding protein